MSRRDGAYSKYLRRGKNKLQGPKNKPFSRPKGKHDWTPSGYNYMGPGNVMDDAPAQNFADEFAVQHDTAYGEFSLQNPGQDPKYVYVEGADDVFENQMALTRETWSEEAAYQIFRGKRKLSEFGLLPRKRLQKWTHKDGSLYNMDEGTQAHYSIWSIGETPTVCGSVKHANNAHNLSVMPNNKGMLTCLNLPLL